LTAITNILGKEKHMSTPSDRLNNQTMASKKDLAEMIETIRDIAQENLGQTGTKASEYSVQERDKVHGVACACEQFISKRPLRSFLLATGAGWLLGRFWKCR
jgi:ElaB/YqjD/DUF883 family membrane-anchored ribosome-binding protein